MKAKHLTRRKNSEIAAREIFDAAFDKFAEKKGMGRGGYWRRNNASINRRFSPSNA